MKQKKFARYAARLLLMLTVFAVCVAVLPSVPGLLRVDAENTSVSVGSYAEWQAQVATLTAGSTTDVILTADITLAHGQTLTIPADTTVNLYMDSHTIQLNTDAPDWQNYSDTLLSSAADLTVYSGTVANGNSGTGKFIITKVRNEMGCSSKEQASNNYVCIQNSGNLTLNSGVSVAVSADFQYKGDDCKSGCHSTLIVMTTGIYNTETTCSCVINNASVSSTAYGASVAYNRYHDQGAYVYSRAILGGTVTVNGKLSSISAFGMLKHGNPGSNICGTGYGYGETLCIATEGQITVTGGTFSCSGEYTVGYNLEYNDACKVLYTLGAFGYTTLNPVITDGTVTLACNNTYTAQHADQDIRQFTVSKMSGEFKTPTTTVPSLNTTGWNGAKNEASSGIYKDECNNSYTVGASSSQNSQSVVTITRGAPGFDKSRVHIVYRFFETSNKNNLIDFVTYGETDNRVNAAEITNFTVGHSSKLNTSYTVKAMDSANNYYWTFLNVASSTLSGNTYGEVANMTGFATKGSTLTGNRPDGANYTNYTVSTTSTNPVYIFIDYVKNPTASITASFGSAGYCNVTYTGSSPIPNVTPGFTAYICKTGYNNIDWTADYNLAGAENATDKLEVAYSYVRNNNSSDAGTGLPVNVGTYTVTAAFENDTEQNRSDDVFSKNRTGGTPVSFTLHISPAESEKGTLPASVSLTYGQTLNDVLNLSSFKASGCKGEQLGGTFTYSDGSSEGTSYRPAGEGTVKITWTPSVSDTNYKSTPFDINYTVAKATLTITPTTAAVTYGEDTFSVPFNASVSGFVANDNTVQNTNNVLNALNYIVRVGDNWMLYSPGNISVGTYDVRTQVGSLPILDNYNVIHADGGDLTVNKRPLAVTVSALTRSYNASDYSVTVQTVINNGIFGGDSVYVNTVSGGLDINTAGTRVVTGITNDVLSAALAGSAKNNYVIASVGYASGSSLTVEISKGNPSVTAPVISDTYYYQFERKLSDIALGTVSGGTWTWFEPDTNPTVAVSSYKAVYTPNDSANYNTVSAMIAVNILPSDVHISYSATVTYGDACPDITQYSYNCVNDPTFSIGNVATAGNIKPSTDYTRFAPVGTYTVTLNGSSYHDTLGNYNLIVENGSVYVQPKPITVTADSATITYGDAFNTLFGRTVGYSDDFVGSDTANSLTADGSEPKFVFSTDYNYTDNYGTGTYNIYVTLPENERSANYEMTFVTGTLTVEKATLTVTGKNINVPYGSNAVLTDAYTLAGLRHNETTLSDAVTGSPVPVTTYYAGAPVQTDGYVFDFDFSGCASANYIVKTVPGKISVVKGVPEIITLPTASANYGTPLRNAVFTGGSASVPGRFVFDAADSTPPYNETPYNTDNIVYSVTFIPDDSVNYEKVSGLQVLLTVGKCPVAGSLLLKGTAMAGQTLTADVSALKPSEKTNYVFAWYVDGVVVVGANTDTYTVADADSNKTVKAVATAVGSYEGSAETSAIVCAAGKTPVSVANLTVSGTGSVVYNGAQQPVSVLNANPSAYTMGTITVRYNGSVTAPSAAGVYAVTADIAYSGASNALAPVFGLEIGTLTVTKAPYDVLITVAEKVYDGSNVASVASKSIINGAVTLPGDIADDVIYNENTTNFVFDNANVGTGKTVNYGGAMLTGTAAGNYELHVTVTNANAGVITPKTLVATVDADNRAYMEDNTTVDLVFFVDITSYASCDTDADVYFVPCTGSISTPDAGTHTVSYDASAFALAGAKAANYSFSITNSDVDVVIDKAEPDYPMPQISILTYDSARTMNDVDLGDSRWSWTEDDGNSIPDAGTFTYTAIFLPTDTVNYKQVEKQVTVVVNKAVVTVAAVNYTLTYGDVEPTYDYSVTGLTGSHTKDSLSGYVLLDCAYAQGSPVVAGGYTIQLRGNYSSNNYSFRYSNGLLTVNKRELRTNATADSRLYNAVNSDVTVHFSAPTNIYASDVGSIAMATNTVIGTLEDNTAGTRTVTYTAPALTGAAAGNYKLTVNPEVLTVEITKAVLPGVQMPTTARVVYGSQLSTAVFTSTMQGDGVFRMVNSNSFPEKCGTYTDIYQVEFIPTDSENYATRTAYITLTVERKAVNISLYLNGTAQEGQTLRVNSSQIPDYLTQSYQVRFVWYRLNAATDDLQLGTFVGEGASYDVTSGDRGYYIACAVEISKQPGDTSTNIVPYVCNDRVVTSETVKELQLTFWQKMWNLCYSILSKLLGVFSKLGD